MKLDTLAKKCFDNLDMGIDCVVLVLPWQGRGDRLRLLKTRGPFGELLCENPAGETVCRFDAKKILKWIEKEAQ